MHLPQFTFQLAVRLSINTASMIVSRRPASCIPRFGYQRTILSIRTVSACFPHQNKLLFRVRDRRSYGLPAVLNTVSSARIVTSVQCFRRTHTASSLTDAHSYHDATIFALSTAPGRAAIAIVRCSGPACHQIYRALCPQAPEPQPRHATLRKLYAPGNRSSILDPGALLLHFPGPDTVTGEDVLELHLHGGRATVRAVLSAISSVSSHDYPIRPAEAGEFTQRAFYNGRMDLTQVEALGDTLAAETEAQRILAANGAGGQGVLRDRYDNWKQQLLQARGELEALIDFSEDQHFDESPALLARGVAEKVHVLLRQIDASIQNAARGELLRNGIKVALLGPPNVGKSSLLNRIVGREAAIVSSTAGTTRDVVETNLDINGFFCNFGDLAGIRGSDLEGGDTVSDIEQEGIRRAKVRALEADVVLVVHTVETRADGSVGVGYSQDILEAVKDLDSTRQQIIHVINKIDLLAIASDEVRLDPRWIAKGWENSGSDESAARCIADTISSSNLLRVTCNPRPGQADGIPQLLARLTEAFQTLTEAMVIPGIEPGGSGFEESLGASERQARLLDRCRKSLNAFLETVEPSNEGLEEPEEDIDIVMAAEHLREAARCLARMTGRGADAGDVEDVLGVVFEKFCVGK